MAEQLEQTPETDAGEALAQSTSEASLWRSQQVSERIETELKVSPGKYRVLTGDRPTGELHIGHYFGSLANRVRLQDLGVDTWVVIADYQVITDRDGVGPVRDRVYSAIANYLAVGIDPQHRPEHIEPQLYVALSNLLLHNAV